MIAERKVEWMAMEKSQFHFMEMCRSLSQLPSFDVQLIVNALKFEMVRKWNALFICLDGIVCEALCA